MRQGKAVFPMHAPQAGLTQLPQACKPSIQAVSSTIKRSAFRHGLLHRFSSHCCLREAPFQQWNFPSRDQHLFFHGCPDLRLHIPPSPGTGDSPLNRVSACTRGTMQTACMGGPFRHPSLHPREAFVRSGPLSFHPRSW